MSNFGFYLSSLLVSVLILTWIVPELKKIGGALERSNALKEAELKAKGIAIPQADSDK